MNIRGQLLSCDRKQIDLGSRMEGLEFEQEQDHGDIRLHNSRLGKLEDKMQLMGDLLIKNEKELTELRKKVHVKEAH